MGTTYAYTSFLMKKCT